MKPMGKQSEERSQTRSLICPIPGSLYLSLPQPSANKTQKDWARNWQSMAKGFCQGSGNGPEYWEVLLLPIYLWDWD